MQTYVGNVLKWREKKREIEMCMWVLRVKLKGEEYAYMHRKKLGNI